MFVSSVIEGFGDYRDAARKGIEAAGALPVMVNEDLPSQITSSRNACLDAIDSSDYVLTIVGERGGWTTPSRRLVVEEEFEHARVRNLPILAFVQETTRDPDAERFARRLSEYVDGMFRTKFETPDDLQKQVERAVRGRVDPVSSRNSEGPDLSSCLVPERQSSGGPTVLRLVLEPERQEEVIDPVRIASDEFRQRLYELGHGRAVRLFSFSRGKNAEMKGAVLVVEQDDPNSRHRGAEHVRLELAESGRLVLDGNVTGRSGSPSAADDMREAFVVEVQALEEVLASFFRFSAALYGEIDPHQRHEKFYYNVGLFGLGHRTLERSAKSKESYGMSMRNSDAIAAFTKSRALSRAALAGDVRDEIGRVSALLEREAT